MVLTRLSKNSTAGDETPPTDQDADSHRSGSPVAREPAFSPRKTRSSVKAGAKIDVTADLESCDPSTPSVRPSLATPTRRTRASHVSNDGGRRASVAATTPLKTPGIPARRTRSFSLSMDGDRKDSATDGGPVLRRTRAASVQHDTAPPHVPRRTRSSSGNVSESLIRQTRVTAVEANVETVCEKQQRVSPERLDASSEKTQSTVSDGTPRKSRRRSVSLSDDSRKSDHTPRKSRRLTILKDIAEEAATNIDTASREALSENNDANERMHCDNDDTITISGNSAFQMNAPANSETRLPGDCSTNELSASKPALSSTLGNSPHALVHIDSERTDSFLCTSSDKNVDSTTDKETDPEFHEGTSCSDQSGNGDNIAGKDQKVVSCETSVMGSSSLSEEDSTDRNLVDRSLDAVNVPCEATVTDESPENATEISEKLLVKPFVCQLGIDAQLASDSNRVSTKEDFTSVNMHTGNFGTPDSSLPAQAYVSGTGSPSTSEDTAMVHGDDDCDLLLELDESSGSPTKGDVQNDDRSPAFPDSPNENNDPPIVLEDASDLATDVVSKREDQQCDRFEHAESIDIHCVNSEVSLENSHTSEGRHNSERPCDSMDDNQAVEADTNNENSKVLRAIDIVNSLISTCTSDRATTLTTAVAEISDGGDETVVVPRLSPVPRGLPKSRRPWKPVRSKVSSVRVLDSVPYSVRMEKARAQQSVKGLERRLREEKLHEKELLRQRRLANKKRTAENERKGEVYQVVKNPNKIKRMKKKQLRTLQSRDTTVIQR